MQTFIDSAIIHIKAGDGGKGRVSFRHEKYIPRGGPDGGDGGKGGDIYVEVDPNLSSLSHFKRKKIFQAENGQPGDKSNRHGKDGQNLTIKLPPGTLVLIKNGQEKVTTYDFNLPSKPALIAKGGKGGKGNARFSTPTQRAPRYSTNGQPGQSFEVEMELKLLADIGLVGLPNAGKSTLLSLLTNAQPKIENYAFTTLEPNLGMAEVYDQILIIADIPGLVAGASQGKGLGDQFLKHIERTAALVYVVSLEPLSESVAARYHIVHQELEQFNRTLITKPSIVVLSKADLATAEELGQRVAYFNKLGIRAIPCSTSDPASIVVIKQQLLVLIEQARNKKNNHDALAEVHNKRYSIQDLPNVFAKTRRDR